MTEGRALVVPEAVAVRAAVGEVVAALKADGYRFALVSEFVRRSRR